MSPHGTMTTAAAATTIDESMVEPLLPTDKISIVFDENNNDEDVRVDAAEEQEDEHLNSSGNNADNTTTVNNKSSLAWAATTPWAATILIPIIALATHALFIYGQTQPMWRLVTHNHVDVWVNATGMESKLAFDALALDRKYHIVQDDDENVQTFTYSFAIKELWKAENMPGKFVPRLAAILLILFSGVWPHLKLVLLNLNWMVYVGNSKRRTRTLHWLSTCGKWSLADVLVVCVMVGVLCLDWDVDPTVIQNGIAENLTTIIAVIKSLYTSTELCSQALKLNCRNPSSLMHKLKCDACTRTINVAFYHPNWASGTGKRLLLNEIATSGSGKVQLRVEGMHGIYTFCGAVILSILLSLIVDVMDYRATRAAAAAEEPQEDITSISRDTEAAEPLLPTSNHDCSPLQVENGTDDDRNDDSIGRTAEEPLSFESTCTTDGDADVGRIAAATSTEPSRSWRHLSIDNETVDPTAVRDPPPSRSWKRGTGRLCSLVILVLIILAISMRTMERRTNGAIPQLLYEILGIDWTKSYSLYSLTQTTGAAGGWDILLMGTFALFMVIGPLLRSLLCVLLAVLPTTNATTTTTMARETILTSIDMIGAFCAWEVFVVAFLMVDLLMPSITSTIILDDRCSQIINSPNGGNTDCLEVEFDTRTPFLLVVIGGALLLLVSNLAVRYYHGREKERQQRNELDVQIVRECD